ncbi:hypothetical protein AURDEDRAFT_111640 [Auricularia subglabra TFB-10046 SS5]|nr:hypothetical protein AURDEDRAFT_111640 [Auricularia subglabra TFB-10046 SS5]
MDSRMPPPPPFADFDFSFDPSLQPLLPDVPPSAELFSPTETTTLLGFLDNFNFGLGMGAGFDDIFAQQPGQDPAAFMQPPPPPSVQEEDYRQQQQQQQTLPPPLSLMTNPPPVPESKPTLPVLDESQSQTARSQSGSSSGTPTPQPSTSSGAGTKKQLSGPQKRLNHIMSEQKRRNAIRDGYATLTTMLAPAGTNIKDALPRRGRPRGSGARGKGRGKGKSGVLFRAVEYIAWLQENCDALEDEIARVEAYPAAR